MVRRQPEDSALAQIRDGMAVYDRNGEKISMVKQVYAGAESEEVVAEGRVQGALSDPEDSVQDDRPVAEEVVETITLPYELPEDLRERLLRRGFLKIEGEGLLAPNNYVTPDQIAGVSEDRVVVRAAKDDLIKR